MGKRLKVELKKGGILNSVVCPKEPIEQISLKSSKLGEDSFNNMTNMIYEGTTGANTELLSG